MSIEIDLLKRESLPETDVGGKNELSPSEDTLRRLGEHLKKRLDKLKELRDRSDWEKEKAAAFNAYHGVPKPRTLPFAGAANYACPLPRIGVDAFHANVMASLFPQSNRMLIKADPVNKGMAHTAKKVGDYMTYVMNFEADSYEVFDDSDKKSNMFGIGYVEPTYVKEEIYETVEITETKRDFILNPVTQKPELKEKILANMSSRAAATLREDLESRGPMRLSEVEAQQKEILKTVRRLADEGQIVIGGGGGDDAMV